MILPPLNSFDIPLLRAILLGALQQELILVKNSAFAILRPLEIEAIKMKRE